jgi:hypothetical protein
VFGPLAAFAFGEPLITRSATWSGLEPCLGGRPRLQASQILSRKTRWPADTGCELVAWFGRDRIEDARLSPEWPNEQSAIVAKTAASYAQARPEDDDKEFGHARPGQLDHSALSTFPSSRIGARFGLLVQADLTGSRTGRVEQREGAFRA